MLKIEQKRGIYYLYINGNFYCTCDNSREVDEEIKDLQKNKIIL